MTLSEDLGTFQLLYNRKGSPREIDYHLTISYRLYFLYMSKVSSMLHHFVVFHQKICFYHVHFSSLDSVKFLKQNIYWATNQKPESVIKNCLWNFIITTQSNEQWCFHFLSSISYLPSLTHYAWDTSLSIISHASHA